MREANVRQPSPRERPKLGATSPVSGCSSELGRRGLPRRARTSSWLAVALVLAVPFAVLAQAGQGQRGAGAGAAAPGQGPAAPGGGRAGGARGAAPVDLSGYWVSIVTEDWIERMSPDSPPSGVGRGGRGQFDGGGPPAGTPPAAASTAKPDPCRAYGAAGSLRVPGRLNITWADDNTLKIDLDAGTQTRLLRFTPAPAPAQRTLQGHSIATWDTGARGGRGGGRGGPAPAAGPTWGSLRVVTTNMTGGYLLSSRAAYSENAVLTEHFTRHSDFGVDYFTVTAVVEDGPLTRVSSSTFKKEPNGSKFAPTGCDVVR
jgi:hypothetical protein